MLKLTEQLSEAEKEIQRLREPNSSSSTSSISQSMEIVDPQLLDEFEVNHIYNDDVFFMPDATYYFNGQEWINLYI